MSSTKAPYTMKMEYPKSPVAPAKQASVPTSTGQKKHAAMFQSDGKRAAKVKNQAKATAKAPSGLTSSTAIQSIEISSSNFASTLRSKDYISSLDKKYRTGRVVPKLGSTPTPRLTLRTPKAQAVVESKNSFAAGRPSTIISPTQIPFATPKATRTTPSLANGLGSSVMQPPAEAKTAKAPKRLQPKQSKPAYSFRPSFNVASRAQERKSKVATAQPTAPKKNVHHACRTKKAGSFVAGIAPTSKFSTLSKKQSFAEKPQHVSPLNFSFQDGPCATAKPVRARPRKEQQADLLSSFCAARGLSAQKKLMGPE